MKVPEHILQAAIREARKSESPLKHGAVSFTRGKLLHRGFNRWIPASKGRKCSLHAEIGAVRHLPYRTRFCSSPVEVLVVRISKTLGMLGPSRPCEKCIKMLFAYNVRRVWYSTETGDIAWMPLAQA